MYVAYHASTSGFRRTRINRLHGRMPDLATNIRTGRSGGILNHDLFSIPVRLNDMDHSIPMVCQSGKKEWGGTYRETNGGKDGISFDYRPGGDSRLYIRKGRGMYPYHPDKRDILFASMWWLCDLVHHFRSVRKGVNYEVFRAKPSSSGACSYTPPLYR